MGSDARVRGTVRPVIMADVGASGPICSIADVTAFVDA